MVVGQQRQRHTAQGAAVEQALRASDGFASAQDVFAELRAAGAGVGLSTVYRHLQALVTSGQADVIHNPDGQATYRFCGSGAATAHHHHLVCRACGRAVEVEGRAVERWAAQVADKHGYVDVDHTVEVFGRCPRCARTATATPGRG
jgi:Fur family ferric uptake transcriptional regulator